MIELPDGWAMSSLAEIADINPRHPRDLEHSLPVSFVRMPALSEAPPDFEFTEQRELGEVRKGFTHFAEGDVLFAKITPCMENGKAAVASSLVNGLGCGTTELHILRPRAGISSKYIYYFIHRDAFREEAARNFTGTAGQLRVPLEFIRDAGIPLAPVNEQSRIVAKLERLLRRVNAAQARLATVPRLVKRFRQSVLAAASSGKLTASWRVDHPDPGSAEALVAALSNAHERIGGHKAGNAAAPTDDVHTLMKGDLPTSWDLTELRNVVAPGRPITYGILKPGPDVANGVPYVRVADFPCDFINLSMIRRTTKQIESSYSRARLREGDILLSIRGTVGRVCVVPKELNEANITQDSARLTIQSVVDAGYIEWLLRSPSTQDRMRRAIKGVAIRGINIGDV